MNKEHQIWNWPQFKGNGVPERMRVARAVKLCLRCLNGHKNQDKCEFKCKHCGEGDNNLLCLKHGGGASDGEEKDPTPKK